MDLIRNFKIHAAALIIVVLAELVGVQKFGLVVLLPAALCTRIWCIGELSALECCEAR